MLTPHKDLLLELTGTKMGITLAELRGAIMARGGTRVDTSTIWHMLRRLALSNKRQSLGAAEQERPDVPREHRRWRVWQRHLDLDRFVFLDETVAATYMVRRTGGRRRASGS